MAADQKRALYMGAAGLGLIVLVWGGLALFDLVGGAGGDMQRVRRDMGRMQALSDEYRKLAGDRERLASAGNRAQGTLYAILDGITRGHGIAGNVRFMKPSVRQEDGGPREELVSMGVAGLYSDQLVRFLHQVEIAAGGLSVESANIRRTRTDMMDAEITVSMAVPEG